MRKFIMILLSVLFLISFFVLMSQIKSFFTSTAPNVILLRNIMIEMFITCCLGSVVIFISGRKE